MKKNKLETKIMKITNGTIKFDENGNKYIPVCSYHWHIGIIGREEICLNRKCRHYERHYLNSNKMFCYGGKNENTIWKNRRWKDEVILVN